MKPSTNHVIWLWTLIDLLCTFQLPWTTLLTNFLPMNRQNHTSNSSCFCLPMVGIPTEMKHDQVVVKKQNREEEGSKQLTSNYTAPTEYWSLDLVQQRVLLRKARTVKRLMLVTPITCIHKNSFVATWPRWIPLSYMLSFTTWRISSCLGSYVMLIRSTLEWNGVLLSITC